MIDKVPRELRPEQKQALRILARHVVSQLELRRRSRELAAAREQSKEFKKDMEKLRAELAKARRELARSKASTRPAARRRATRPRK